MGETIMITGVAAEEVVRDEANVDLDQVENLDTAHFGRAAERNGGGH